MRARAAGGSGTRSWKTRSCCLSGRSRSRSSDRRRAWSGPRSRAPRCPCRRARGRPRRGGGRPGRSAARRAGRRRSAASPRRAAGPSAIRSQRQRTPGSGRAEPAVELAAAAVDGADDRVERDHLDADVALLPCDRARRRPPRTGASPTRRRARSAGAMRSSTTRGGGAGGRNRIARPAAEVRCPSSTCALLERTGGLS